MLSWQVQYVIVRISPSSERARVHLRVRSRGPCAFFFALFKVWPWHLCRVSLICWKLWRSKCCRKAVLACGGAQHRMHGGGVLASLETEYGFSLAHGQLSICDVGFTIASLAELWKSGWEKLTCSLTSEQGCQVRSSLADSYKPTNTGVHWGNHCNLWNYTRNQKSSTQIASGIIR